MTQPRAFSLAGASVACVVLLLVGNGLCHGNFQSKEVDFGPAGFPQQVESLGLVETAFVGPVSLVAEDRIPQQDGSFRRQPSMVVNGRDPSPVNELMRIHAVHIQALGAPGSKEPIRYEVHGDFADLPLEEGATVIALDRSQNWRIQQPRFFFPHWGNGQGLSLKSPTADLNPLNGDVFCSGSYVLEASGLLMEGIGLRLEGETGFIFFGESQGEMQWSLESSSGQFVGTNDGGGSLIQGDRNTTLFLFAKEVCQVDFPESSPLAGNLKTQGFQFLLEPGPDGWEPHELRGQAPSTWTDWRGQLHGQNCLTLWKEGEMQQFELFGPLRGEWKNEDWPKISAHQKALFLSGNQVVQLFGNVEALQVDGRLLADWVQLTPQNWAASGNVHYFSDGKGELLAEKAHYQEWEGIQAWGNVIAKPTQPDIDQISAPSMRWLERGDFFIDEPFVMEGHDEIASWTLRAQQLKTRQLGDDYLSIAKGKVQWERGDLTAHGDRLIHRGGRQATLSGQPAWATFPVKNGLATARGARFVLANENFHIQEKPEIFIPASSLGLAGETVHASAKFITRNEAGTWEMKEKVRFKEALVGSAKRATWNPHGTLDLFADENLASLAGKQLNGDLFSANAKHMTWLQSGELFLQGEVDAWRQAKDTQKRLRIWANQVSFGQSSGWAKGRVRFEINQDKGRANKATWTSDQGEPTVHLEGNAQLEAKDGRADGHLITRGPRFLTVESLAPALASLALVDGRKIRSRWIQWDHISLLLASEAAVVEGQKP